ncbi:MAG TPA: SpoIIE family protein phosphatase [Polyangia bacterium]|nr:SpoIIE family protein phosphatase [Polyangia bacterium]
MKFRAVLLGVMLLLLAGVVLATMGAAALVLNRSARRDLGEQLGRARQVFEQLHTDRQLLYRSESRVVAEEPRVKAVVATEDVTHETVLGVASELRRALQCDLFLITDGRGRLVADTKNPQADGFDMAGVPLIARALASGEAAGIWRDAENAYQVQSRRLAFGATPVGVLVIGYQLDDRVARTVERQTASAVVIELDGRTVAMSASEGLERVDRAALTQALSRVPTGVDAPTEVAIGKLRYLAVAAALPGAGEGVQLRYLILRSLDRALAASRRLEHILYGIGTLGLLGALLAAVALSQRLSRPLDQLVAFTRRIAAGDLASRARVQGPLEVETLGDAMNQMVQDLDRSQRELAAKERLEKEMEIAARIQTSILPRRLDIEGLQVSAQMLPATEVGGDYYDLVPTENGCWIGIGDVAGHGLTAGLVMMMIQSVVAALCRRNPTSTPSELLGVLNAVLYDNIRHRLTHDEHVTLSLLRYFTDGRFVFAGAHEEIVVCRQKSGRCETVPTPGTWLGAMRYIGPFTTDSTLHLEPGDLMVLYTDGVTEAMNVDGEQFGLERLCAQIEARPGDSVDAIRDRVLAELARFTATQFDDVTILILRFTGIPTA